jgi:hypothetical protein
MRVTTISETNRYGRLSRQHALPFNSQMVSIALSGDSGNSEKRECHSDFFFQVFFENIWNITSDLL